MSEHTPGPWTNPEGSVSIFCNYEDRPNISKVTDVHGTLGAEASVANARLIAAAPELLEALKTAISIMQDYDIDEALAGEFDIFTDAWTKATGISFYPEVRQQETRNDPPK